MSQSPIPDPADDSGQAQLEHACSVGSSLSDEDIELPPEMTALTESPRGGSASERALEEGACVCFFTRRGHLLVVRPVGKVWELHPIVVPRTSYDADGNQRLVYYPPEAIFTVMRKGKLVGFRSLAAEGRTLQAVWKDDAPHRVNNHNFGDWESWELTPEGLTNVKWKNRPLGFDVKEVRAVAVEDLKGAHRSHLRSVRQWQSKAENLEFKIGESDRRVKDVLRASTRQKELHAKEMAHVRSRMDEALQERQKHSLESLQTGAAFSQVELRLQQMTAEKEALETSASHAESKYQGLLREMAIIRERHDAEMHRLQLAHSSEMNALTREKDLELKRASQEFDVKLRHMQDELDSKARKKDYKIEELEGRMGGTMREKEQQIMELVEECRRLHTALKVIKNQVELAHATRHSAEPRGTPLTLSPGLTSPILRVSTGKGIQLPSRSPSLSSRSGRLSADAILCLDPVASPTPAGSTPHGRSRLQPSSARDGNTRSADRSGARAPTPTDAVFPAKDMSPTSARSDGNPPSAFDNDSTTDSVKAVNLRDSFPRSGRRVTYEDESDGSEGTNEVAEKVKGHLKLSRSFGSSLAKESVRVAFMDSPGRKLGTGARRFPIDGQSRVR